MIALQGCGDHVRCEIRLILGAVEAKDPYTANHSERVAILARELAVNLELPDNRVKKIFLAGILHDVGKLAIPDAILLKPGKLDQTEMELVRRHPMIGERLMSCVPLPEDVFRGMAEHHERPDGKGYPRALTLSELSLPGKILKIADVFDALCSERPYKEPVGQDEAYRIIAEGAGTEFDAEIVALLLRNPFSAEFMSRRRRGSITAYLRKSARGCAIQGEDAARA